MLRIRSSLSGGLERSLQEEKFRERAGGGERRREGELRQPSVVFPFKPRCEFLLGGALLEIAHLAERRCSESFLKPPAAGFGSCAASVVEPPELPKSHRLPLNRKHTVSGCCLAKQLLPPGLHLPGLHLPAALLGQARRIPSGARELHQTPCSTCLSPCLYLERLAPFPLRFGSLLPSTAVVEERE